MYIKVTELKLYIFFRKEDTFLAPPLALAAGKSVSQPVANTLYKLSY